jgi:tRNA threonylcarbamoyladenosine biosynthesis protein TsaE
VLRRLADDPALEVPSPSFTLVQSYDLPNGEAAHHYDLYRLSGPADLAELGWDEAREGIVLVEWPDRLGALRPDDAIALALAPGAGEEERVATLSGPPERLRGLPA